jgi:hypothetical protein
MTLYTATPCPCRSKACKDWHIEPVAAIQGVSFTKEQAEAVVELLNEDVWKLGRLVHDASGWPWVYLGARKTSVGTLSRQFVKCEVKSRGPATQPWLYQAVKRDTLIAKFPDLAKVWVEEAMG